MEREEHARGRGFRSQESPTCPFSPPCSHLYRSGPPRTRARNYTSRQDASARTRTGASAMATVLSRALKLPGKKPQPRDHLAPLGLGRWGGEAPEAKPIGSWPQPGRRCEIAEARRCNPRGLGSTLHQGHMGPSAGRGSPARGEPGRDGGKDSGGARGWWPRTAVAANVRARIVAAVPREGR